MGHIGDAQVLLAAAGLIFIAILMARRIGSAILLGIVAITLAGIPLGLAHWPEHFFSLPHPWGTLLKLDLRSASKIGLGELMFVFFFVDLFDNVGNFVGVCEEGGFLRDGKLPRASRALLADAFGTIFGALTGTSTVTSYIESAAGAAAGARTGLGNIIIAALFLVAMFCAPLVAAIPTYATAPALILAGALMCGSLARVQWDDFSSAFPAFITLVATLFTFSIATGLSLGLLSFTFHQSGHREASRNQSAGSGYLAYSFCFDMLFWEKSEDLQVYSISSNLKVGQFQTRNFRSGKRKEARVDSPSSSCRVE